MYGEKTKILLTGASGFLGKYVLDALLSAGLDCTSYAQKDLDVLSREDTISKTEGFNTVIHLAGNIRTPVTDSAEMHFRVNSLGTLNVLDACKVNKISRIILASSTEIYGDSVKSGKIVESTATAPVDFYGQSKLLAECFCREYATKYGVDFTALRFTYLYGHGMDPSRVVYKIINAAAGNERLDLAVDPGAFMDMLYVKDAARAVLLALRAKCSRNKIFNISSGHKTKVIDLVAAVKYFFPKADLKISNKNENKKHCIYDNHMAKTLLNFRPEYNLKLGLKDYFSYIKK